jgi:hypothetical protein
MKRINGAGVLIIENYYNQICFTVFKSPQGYSEPGGLIDKGEIVKETACRECLEETANLIKLYPNNLSDYVVVDNYIAFIIYLVGIRKTDYYQNLKITRDKCSHHWNETSDMKRIPIQNVNLKTFSVFKDFNGINIMLRQRTYKVIQKSINLIKKIITKKPYYLHQYEGNLLNKCLSGTITYSIQNLELCSIVVAPDIQFSKYKNIRNCNKKLGGLNIQLTGFDYQPIDLLDNLKIKKKFWIPDVIEKHNNKLIFRSNTLDDLSIKLNKDEFRKINGLIFGKQEWFMTFDCNNIDEIIKILLKSTWSIYLICIDKKIKWKQIVQL